MHGAEVAEGSYKAFALPETSRWSLAQPEFRDAVVISCGWGEWRGGSGGELIKGLVSTSVISYCVRLIELAPVLDIVDLFAASRQLPKPA